MSLPISPLFKASLLGTLPMLPMLLMPLVLPSSSSAQFVNVVQASDGETPLAILQTADGLLIHGPSGTAMPVDLPAGTDLQWIEPLPGGWVAVGTRRIEEAQDLYLLRARGAHREELPVPGDRDSALRGSPRLAVDGGKLSGLVWLEGSRQEELSVWAAAWNGDGWGDPELVSPPGPGAQLAPSVAVLGDGSWLLVWAAVDGEDDEILWSRRAKTGWTTPARIHSDNTVPDITPVVAPIRGGALAAWSFLDYSHFRLRTARFDGAAWEVSEPFGFDGSLGPRFVRRAGRPSLLYRTTSPGGWAITGYDEDGKAASRTFLPQRDGRPAILDLRNPEGVMLALPEVAPEKPAVERWLPWESWEPAR